MAEVSKFHDRLDLKLNVHQFIDAKCGSLNLETGKPEYCDFECPAFSQSKSV